MADFVLNDETVENSYGFTIPNAGINLTQFLANPVMLNSHDNTTQSVIGNWLNTRVVGNQLLATENFDVADEEAKKIAGKVERGFIKAASMGVGFYIDDMQYIGGKVILTKCVLKEASIVAVPSNAKALRLYDMSTGLLVGASELQLQLTDLKNFKTENKTSMKQIILSVAVLNALHLTAQPASEGELDAAILKLNAKLDAEKALGIAATKALTDKLKEAEDALQAQAKLQSKALLDAAVSEGKITNEERAPFEALPLEVATSTLAKIPAKATLGAMVTGGNATGAEPKTFEELMALTDAAKVAFKAASPEKYNKLLQA